ncbi:MAG: vWA domain-containing protein [Cyclobacteriaceae bacterium]
MNWVRGLESFEWIAIGLFILMYILYVFRIFRITKALQMPITAVIWKLLLRFTYFTLFIIALLGPSFGETTKEIKSVGKDIFICIDLSESMNAFDIQPTRLERVKFELKNIMEAFNSDRKGLIMFSNESFMQCPLTYDNNALNLFIQTLNTSLVPNTGTDFGPPLEMALEKLEAEEGTATRQKSKIIVLISDGEDFGDDTEEIAQEIKESGIKLFTLGVGTERGSKIKMRRGFKRDNKGNEVITQLNTQSLRKLAADTDGKYFEINDSQNDVERLINTINLIEGELRDSKQMDTKANKYFYFLAAALVLLLLDVLFTVKTVKI